MIDHSQMKHGNMHDNNPSMRMAGHDHYKMMIAGFKKRFYVVLVLTIPITLLSSMIQQFMGLHWQFAGSQYILLALSTIVFFYGAGAVLTFSTIIVAINANMLKVKTSSN
jgi:Cu2+-exporting ATPase